MKKETWGKQIANLLFLLIAVDILFVFFSIGTIASGYKGGIPFWDIQARFVLKIILKFLQFLGLA